LPVHLFNMGVKGPDGLSWMRFGGRVVSGCSSPLLALHLRVVVSRLVSGCSSPVLSRLSLCYIGQLVSPAACFLCSSLFSEFMIDIGLAARLVSLFHLSFGLVWLA
jgi:Mg2+/citrate symporter